MSWRQKRNGTKTIYFISSTTSKSEEGSGCGSVGRAVASNTKGLRFESSHRQKFKYLLNICLLSTVY